jgi:hypothetical protein
MFTWGLPCSGFLCLCQLVDLFTLYLCGMAIGCQDASKLIAYFGQVLCTFLQSQRLVYESAYDLSVN